MPVEGSYTEADLNTHPPFNPMTHKPYDSVVYSNMDGKGSPYKRVAIYDAGQVYAEYGVQYSRVPQQQQSGMMGMNMGMGQQQRQTYGQPQQGYNFNRNF